VQRSEAGNAHMGTDLFFWEGTKAPACIAQPRSSQQVAALLQTAGHFQRPVYVRGGGMSYTNAFGPNQPGSLLLDLSGLNQVREVNPVSRYVVVDCGCTWQQVAKAVAGHNMVVDFPAPLSGSHSTVGGALSQNVPGGMQGVLGLEVALADGRWRGRALGAARTTAGPSCATTDRTSPDYSWATTAPWRSRPGPRCISNPRPRVRTMRRSRSRPMKTWPPP
jgi:FAD/FMN-containing dehydrogenase